MNKTRWAPVALAAMVAVGCALAQDTTSKSDDSGGPRILIWHKGPAGLDTAMDIAQKDLDEHLAHGDRVHEAMPSVTGVGGVLGAPVMQPAGSDGATGTTTSTASTVGTTSTTSTPLTTSTTSTPLTTSTTSTPLTTSTTTAAPTVGTTATAPTTPTTP